MPSYAIPTDLAARKDTRTIADLASDSGTPVPDITVDPNVLAALSDASGEIDSALLVGGEYQPADLTSLSDNSLAKLKRITCELAMAFLYARRPKYDEEGYELALDRAEEWLDKLRKGERVFNVAADIDAGVIEVDGPTVTTYRQINLLRDRVRNTFPSRGSGLPVGRG
jgi:phage gp36-like protein